MRRNSGRAAALLSNGAVSFYSAARFPEAQMPEHENANGDRIVETKTEARAAVTGHHGSTVLLLSTLGVIVLFICVYLYFFA